MMIEAALTRILCVGGGCPLLCQKTQQRLISQSHQFKNPEHHRLCEVCLIYNFGGGCVRAQASQALSVQTQSVQLVYMAVSRTASYRVHFHQIWLH